MTRILTLSGWGQAPDALRPIYPESAQVTECDYSKHSGFEQLCDELRSNEYELVMGWSLGGQLALRLLGQGVVAAEKAVLLCPVHQFVRDEMYAYGMEQWLFEQFYDNYTSDPKRTATRFAGLIAKGDVQMKEVMREMMPHEAVHQVERWADWLKLLGEISLSADALTKMPKTLLIHGEEDQLVRSPQSQWVAKNASDAQLYMMKGCAHAPHLHDSVMVKQLVEAFING